MRLSLAQIYCEWGNVKGNLRRLEKYISGSRKMAADLVVFPELSVHGMWKDHLVRLAAEPIDGPIVRQVARWARKYGIAVGFGMAEKRRGKPFNAYVLVDSNGCVRGVYRKNFVTRLEQAFYRGDRRRPVFELGNLRVAVAICADCCHRELLESYGRRGVDLVLMPHAWDADPILKNGKIASFGSMEDMVDTYARGLVVRYRTHRQMLDVFVGRLAPICRQHGFYAAFVNQVGQPHPLIPIVGPSFVLDPSGNTLIRSRSKREGILVADIPQLSL